MTAFFRETLEERLVFTSPKQSIGAKKLDDRSKLFLFSHLLCKTTNLALQTIGLPMAFLEFN